MAWTGGALTLLGLLFLLLVAADRIRATDWNRHKALGWLLKDLNSSEPARQQSAWSEIERRRINNRLSEPDQDRVVEKGLRLPASDANRILRGKLLGFIAGRYKAEKLTLEQTNRFFDGGMQIAIAVPSVVRTVGQIPYQITATGAGPAAGCMGVHVVETLVDESPVPADADRWSKDSLGWTLMNSLPAIPTVGRHRLRVTVELLASPTIPISSEDRASPARRVVRELGAEFEVTAGAWPNGNRPMTVAPSTSRPDP